MPEVIIIIIINNNNFIYIALKSNNCPKRYKSVKGSEMVYSSKRITGMAVTSTSIYHFV